MATFNLLLKRYYFRAAPRWSTCLPRNPLDTRKTALKMLAVPFLGRSTVSPKPFRAWPELKLWKKLSSIYWSWVVLGTRCNLCVLEDHRFVDRCTGTSFRLTNAMTITGSKNVCVMDNKDMTGSNNTQAPSGIYHKNLSLQRTIWFKKCVNLWEKATQGWRHQETCSLFALLKICGCEKSKLIAKDAN